MAQCNRKWGKLEINRAMRLCGSGLQMWGTETFKYLEQWYRNLHKKWQKMGESEFRASLINDLKVSESLIKLHFMKYTVKLAMFVKRWQRTSFSHLQVPVWNRHCLQ